MPIWTLGTASLRGDGRTRTATLAMRCHLETWLFNVGDDAQRQFLKVATSATMGIKYLRIARIFVTSFDGPNLYGLPAMLCALVRLPLHRAAFPPLPCCGRAAPECEARDVQSQAKSESIHAKMTPIHIYGPEGIHTYLDTMLRASDTFVGVPVVVYELVAGAVPEEKRAAVCLNKRSRLHVVRSSPDRAQRCGRELQVL